MQLLQGLEKFHAMFNKKSNLRKIGVRKTWIKLNELKTDENYRNKKRIWFHCASLGEFYQAKPIIELLSDKSKYYILLSFYSPSGFEHLKNYKVVDEMIYLPNDTRKNSNSLVELIKPDLTIFAKYEFWFNYLDQLNKSNYPFVFISSIFRPNHYLFRSPFKSFSIDLLVNAISLFVQDDKSLQVLEDNGINNGVVVGDTRLDAVLTLKDRIIRMTDIEKFSRDNEVLIIGSSWSKDDTVYHQYINDNPQLKVIIAPHEVSESRINQLSILFKDNCIIYSEWDKKETNKQVLIIDSIGILNSLYQYASMVYIGGGFGVSIHNTLEPAVFGVPLMFGPRYKKFEEARFFVQHKLAYVVENSEDFGLAMNWSRTKSTRMRVESGMDSYFNNNRNASLSIYNELINFQLI